MRGPLALQLEKTAALFVDLQEEHRPEHFPSNPLRPLGVGVERRSRSTGERQRAGEVGVAPNDISPSADQTKKFTRYPVEGFDAVLANVTALQRSARDAGIPCFHAAYVVDVGAGLPGRFHPLNADGTSAFSDKGNPLSALCPEVGPVEGEEVLVKSQASAFSDSERATGAPPQGTRPMSLSAALAGEREGARRVSDGKGEVPSAQQALEQVAPKWAPVRPKNCDHPRESDGALAPKLRARGIEWILVAGVWTEACVAATVRDAVGLGFRVLLVKDACGSGSIAMHQTGILNLANRLYGGAVVDTARACRMLAGETAEAWMVQGSVPLRFTYQNAAGLYEGL